jgi:hypothetical protein
MSLTMATELEHPDNVPHLDHLLTPEEESDLNFLMAKMANCKANLERGPGVDGILVLEYQLAELQYRHRWTEKRLEWVKEQSLRDMEEIALMRSRIDTMEKFFIHELSQTVKTAVAEQHKLDEFDRMVGIYKNGLKRGAERVLKQPRKN